jgi:hypothetical protein
MVAVCKLQARRPAVGNNVVHLPGDLAVAKGWKEREGLKHPVKGQPDCSFPVRIRVRLELKGPRVP